jgi:DNA-binding GntR family transcriptional regulator
MHSTLVAVTGYSRASGSLSDAAYFRIRDQIISLELEPGTMIEESELMARLGIGRTPIREALNRLAWEKFVVIVPRRGIFVSEIAIADLPRIYEARMELEGFGARLAADRANEPEQHRMRELIVELKQLKNTVDNTELIRIDQNVHLQVYQATHNPYLISTLEQYYNLSLRIWFLVLPKVARVMQAVQEHDELLQLILAKDGMRAERLMRQQIGAFHDEVKKILYEGRVA